MAFAGLTPGPSWRLFAACAHVPGWPLLCPATPIAAAPTGIARFAQLRGRSGGMPQRLEQL